MKKGMQIITALVLIMAVMIAGAVAYTSFEKGWSKVTKQSGKLNPFEKVLTMLTGKKAFTVRVANTQYAINDIEVRGESGTVLKSVENSNVIEFAIDSGKTYSISFDLTDPSGNSLLIQSASFSTGKDNGKTIILSGEYGGDVFQFAKTKVYTTGLKSLGGNSIEFPNVMEFSNEPFSAITTPHSSASTQSLKIDYGFVCPAWDQGSDGVGICGVGKIESAFCFPRTKDRSIDEKGVMMVLDNSVYACSKGLLVPREDQSKIPEEFQEICGKFPPTGYTLGLVNTEINPTLIQTTSSNRQLHFPVQINTYSKMFLNESSDGSTTCLSSERNSKKVSFSRGDFVINLYYYKICPTGYKYDRSTTQGACVKLDPVA